MIEAPLWTVCVPMIPSRWDEARILFASIASEVGSYGVEVLGLMDNKAMSVGEKRTALLRAARGKYVSFVDDDDEISHMYPPWIANALKSDPDIVTFLTHCTLRYADGRVVSGDVSQAVGNPEEEFDPAKITRRRPTQIAVWRTELVRDVAFPKIQWGEDRAWGDEALKRVDPRKEVHLHSALYHYLWSEARTESK